MIVVPPGRFTMGSAPTEAGRDDRKEGPQLVVQLASPFAVARRETTRAQYASFVRESGHSPKKVNCGYRTTLAPTWKYDRADLDWRNPGFRQEDDHPVVCVSWLDAKAYVEWLSKKTGRAYRLLSDAEWEYIARAGVATSRPWGEDAADACKHANVSDLARDRALAPGVQPGKATHPCDDTFAYTAPVGQFAPNPFGLYDVIGNVWEWMDDCWNASLEGTPADGSARRKGDCNLHAVRGGSWIGPPPAGMRVAKRDSAPTGNPYFNLGIRVAAAP